ncbi:MAG: glycine--tRNA ligase subunit alpha, partial [Parachlamydia sp.]|nr:glycine--tRNA ligase subunit alpha [Parachlamydia sp.]
MITFQEMIRKLADFWVKQGCVVHQGYDLEKGAGTANPATFLRSLGPEPYKAFYIEPCRRPTDGRYGTNPTRIQHYFQCQVILKPSPPDIQDLCLKSLEAIGFDLSEHDMRFVHDDWEQPTIGAWGLGWEVWMDGMEVTQFTYFQSVAGTSLKPITGEVTYGLERLAVYLQKVDSIFDIQYNDTLKYGDIYLQNEIEWSHYNFEQASTEMWSRFFEEYEREAKRLLSLNLPLPAYDFVIKASHAFNILDARGVISVTERTGYIARIRDLACVVAQEYLKSREEKGYPLLNRFKTAKISGVKHPERMSDELMRAKPDQSQDFLFEIGSEELPATFVPIGCANLERAARQLFEKENLSFKSLKAYGTPRRLALYVEALSMAKPAQSTEKRGPPLESAYDVSGKPTLAGEGFFRSIGKAAPTLSDLRSGLEENVTIRSIKDVKYLFAEIKTESRPTALILADQLPSLILNLDFPKKMRWADLDITYARPLRWIVALFGDQVIPFIVGDILSGRESAGHRQLSPQMFALTKAQSYFPQLKQHQVMVDSEERRKYILEQLDEIEKKVDGKVIAREQVLPQVINLVEWPFLTYADFDAAFLK